MSHENSDVSGLDKFPPETDESGDVDLGLLRDTLSLSLMQRFERHYAARQFVAKLRDSARERYGSVLDSASETE